MLVVAAVVVLIPVAQAVLAVVVMEEIVQSTQRLGLPIPEVVLVETVWVQQTAQTAALALSSLKYLTT
jgi:hypothetical protein